MASGDISALKYAAGNDADDGDYTTPLAAAIPGKKLQVMGLAITALTTAGVVSLKSGSNTIFHAHLAIGAPLVVGYNGHPVCETGINEALTASNGSNVDSYVSVQYREVEA